MRERTVLLSSIDGLDAANLEKGLKKLIGPDVTVLDVGGCCCVMLPSPEAYAIFAASFTALKADYSAKIKGLLLPNHNIPLYSSFLDYVQDGKLETIYSISRKFPNILDELRCIVEPFDTEMLYTIKAYIENDCSPLLSSYALFVHRNTITYRIKSFSTKTGIQLDSFTDVMFVYELVLSALSMSDKELEENLS